MSTSTAALVLFSSRVLSRSSVAGLALAGLAAAQMDPVTGTLVLVDGQNGLVQGGSAGSARLGGGLSPAGDLDGDGVTDLILAQPENQTSGVPGRIYTLLLASDGSVRAQTEITEGMGGMVGSLDGRDEFGDDVAALGDLDGDGVPDVAVGAPGDDDLFVNSGAVWILFLRADGSVKDEQKLSNLEGGLGFTLEIGDDFGRSVEGVGDLDGDGHPDLAVGAPLDDDGGSNRGAFYVLFLRADGTVRASQKVSATSGLFFGALDDEGRFGSALAALGDNSGDGFLELAVGQERGKAAGVTTGSVWIVSLFSTGLVLNQVVIENGAGGLVGPTQASERFGATLEALGDLDGDGLVDLAVGSPDYDAPSGGAGQGALRLLYLRADGTVRAEDVIGSSEGGLGAVLSNFDEFGCALAVLGDLSGDGSLVLVVGASRDDTTGGDQGAAYVLSLDYCLTLASATFRNTGTNPASYSAPPPMLGRDWCPTVDLTTTGHAAALLIGFTNAYQLQLSGGQTLLVIDATGSGELLGMAPSPGPLATFRAPVPSFPTHCGVRVFTQAVHFGGVLPFALSNAQDLVLGQP